MRALCLVLLLAPALAAETPKESFLAFVAAVLSGEMTEAEKRAAFERYFDFDTWVENAQQNEGRRYTQQERASLKEEWFTLFLSDEFSSSYRARNVQVVEEPAPDGDTSEVIITMQEAGKSEPGRFRVLMTRSGEHWRWHSIPRIADAQPEKPLTPQARLEGVKDAISKLREQAELIAARIAELEAERRKLESEIVEKDAGSAPHSSPLTTAATLGRAVQRADTDALLRAHLPVRRDVPRESLRQRLATESERVASWEPIDSTLTGESTAAVRVRVTLWSSKGASVRVITLPLARSGDEWLVDDTP